LFQYLVIEPTVGGGVLAVELVVGAHRSPCLAFLDRRFKRGQVDFAQRAFAHVGVYRHAFGLLVVGRVMLDGGGDALALDALDDVHAQPRRQVGIFAQVFEVTAVLRHALDVDAGAEHDVHAARAGIAADGGAKVARQRGVPAGRQRHSGGIGRGFAVVTHT